MEKTKILDKELIAEAKLFWKNQVADFETVKSICGDLLTGENEKKTMDFT